MAAFLFVHFIGEEKDGEQVYFSVSTDGLHWHDLNHGKPVLYSGIGAKGVRDPFIVKSPLDGRYYLIATDERIEAGRGWQAAQEQGSKDIIVWESEDLIHWSRERACRVGIPEAGCVWAPEAVFDEQRQEFLVFFASKVKRPGEEKGKHRIYATYTKDFLHFSETFCYMERDKDVIDTTILRSDGHYYRISKDEADSCLILEVSDSLRGEFSPVSSPVFEQLKGVEGPEGYLLADGVTWCVIADRFAEGKGYLPMLTKDLGTGEFTVMEQGYDMGKTRKRHGGVLALKDEEYERLIKFYG